MKNVLLATSILALSAGFASAEITLSGDARMGIIGGSGVDTGFTSRARVKFTMSGETDGGLTFGASFRADNAKAVSSYELIFIDANANSIVDPGEITLVETPGSGANTGTAGSVYISGGFGKLTMGDIDGAAQQAVGQVDGVGLTGLGDSNEIDYYAAGGGTTDPTAAYEYTSGAFTGIVSVTNPDNGNDNWYALGMKYAMGDYTFALGYENNMDGINSQISAGATATFGAVKVKAVYAMEDFFGSNYTETAVSATYTADALAVTAFYMAYGGAYVSQSSYGLGASYDLGGGAKVVGGYADDSYDSAYDLGVSFSF